MFKDVNQGKLPVRGTKYSAYVDVYANEDVTIGAGETKLVPTGIMLDMEIKTESGMEPTLKQKALQHEFMSSHYLQLTLRSSLGKKGLILPNGIGVIDLDFDKEIQMIIHNPVKLKTEYLNNCKLLHNEIQIHSKYSIKKGDRIGQVTLIEHKSSLFNIESNVVRTGGFGSTDK